MIGKPLWQVYAGATLIAVVTALTPSSVVAQDEGEPRLQTILTEIAPTLPEEGDTVHIAGYVRNANDEFSDVSITLRVTSFPFIGREQLDAYASGRSSWPQREVGPAGVEIADIRAGELAPFRLEASIDAFALDRRGVYGLEVSARADGEVSEIHTFLTWMPDADPVPPIQVAWLWPLVDQPVQDQSGIFVNDRLARSLAPGGRLGSLVTAAQGRPITWVVDADLLAAAEAMTGGYRTADDLTGAGADAAAAWLEQLRQAVRDGTDVLALPYADADLAALVRDDRRADISRATALGVEEASRILNATPTVRVAWPSAGFADVATLAALQEVGFQGVVLAGAAVPPAPEADLIYTPTGRADLVTGNGVLPAALADERLAAILRQDTREPGVGPLVVQRVLAETAWIAVEQPNRQRAILVAPPRRWNPDPAVAMQLLAGYDEAAWIKPIGIGDLLKTEEPDIPRGGPIFPEAAREAELPRSHIGAVARLGQQVDEFATILSDSSGLTAAYATALLRVQSSAWADGDGGVTDAGGRYLRSLQEDFDDRVGKIRIISHGTVTLSSNSGTVPVTIANDLDQPVQVRLSLTPRVASRLTVDDPQPVIIAPDSRQTVEVGATAVASGITTVDARLLTVDGHPIGSPTQFNVRATNFGLVGFVVIGGAMVLLVASAAVRIIRRTVKGKQRRPADATAPTERVKA